MAIYLAKQHENVAAADVKWKTVPGNKKSGWSWTQAVHDTITLHHLSPF
jgi:hypothetical protein